MSASLVPPRECRTCASVRYGVRSQSWCHRDGPGNAFEVAMGHVCECWSERPDPFLPQEGDEE